MILAGLGQLRHHLSSVHDLHELLPERLCLGRFLRAESADRLEVEQGVGLTLLAGGFLQGDLCDHAADRRQGTQQPSGVFQEPSFASHGDTVNKLKTPDTSTIVITHYQRLLDYIKPDIVHVLYKGRIVKTAGPELALELEEKGYDWIKKEVGE